jgi:hypothetical protein
MTETYPSDEHDGAQSAITRKPITPKQAQARRQNAKRSTGPKTEKGKEVSRANALKHGVWARTIPVIETGPLSEDRAEIDEFRTAIFEELDPQTVLEEISATRIANLAWRVVGRLPRWEANALCDGRLLPEGRFGLSLHDHGMMRSEDIKSALFTLRTLYGSGHSPYAFEQALNEIWLLCPGEPAIPGWDPDRGVRPESEEGWLAVIDATWPLAGDSLETVIDMLEREQAETQKSAKDIGLADASNATRMVLEEGLLDRLVAMEGRLGRELTKEVEHYWQSRQIPE